MRKTTDQLEEYVEDAKTIIDRLKEEGYTTDQAIEIIKMGIEDMKVEMMYRYSTTGLVLKKIK